MGRPTATGGRVVAMTDREQSPVDRGPLPVDREPLLVDRRQSLIDRRHALPARQLLRSAYGPAYGSTGGPPDGPPGPRHPPDIDRQTPGGAEPWRSTSPSWGGATRPPSPTRWAGRRSASSRKRWGTPTRRTRTRRPPRPSATPT